MNTEKEQVNANPKEQASTVSPANLPDLKAVAAEPAPSALKLETKSQTKPENKVAPEPRKLEVSKPELRKNLVPINLDNEIRRRAYELFEQRRNSLGSETEDWLAAETEVLQRYHQRSA